VSLLRKIGSPLFWTWAATYSCTWGTR